MSRIVIPGGSGFLGQALASVLVARGDDVVILSRGEARPVEDTRTVVWDGQSIGPSVSALEGADALVHLNGRRVDMRAGTRCSTSTRRRPALARGRWSRCVSPGRAPSIKRVRRSNARCCCAWASVSVVATTRRPRKLAQLVRLGLGGRVGSGRQWVSWVGLDDLISAMVLAIDDETMTGVYHVTSPNPVTNAEMMATYRRLLGRRIGLPSPAWLARIGAPILASSASLALAGRRVVPTRLVERGFEFEQQDFEQQDFEPAARKALEACGLL